MSHELVYTSAPQGLKPGSRGFCTVVTTANMARNLMERLESFSGYRHAFMVHEAGAAQNPINYTHYHTAVGGRIYHVLSRIADAGLDYTQRSNKLAHHVALEPGETSAAPGGPAWVMAAPGFFVDQWDGQVRTLAAGNQPTPSDRPPKVCRLWKQLTGDAGWAGVLAESTLGPGNPMSVIFPAGTPGLELVVEALALLPPERRWQVTFSTYFTKAPAGVNCQWRFVLDGTPEATSLRRDVRAAVIDLCRPLGQAQGGELVEAARTGVAPRHMAVRGDVPPPRTATGSLRPQPKAVASDDELDELTLAPLAPPPPVRRLAVPPPWQTAKRPKSILYLLPIAAVGLLILGLGLALGAFWINTQRYLTERASPDLSVKPPNDVPEIPDEPVDEEESGDETQDETEASDLDASTEDEIIEPAMTDGAPETGSETAQEAQPPPSDPFADIREPNNRLRLPPMVYWDERALAKPETNRSPKDLANLHVNSSEDLTLELIANKSESSNLSNYYLKVDEDGEGRRWELRSRGLKTMQGEQSLKIASFGLHDGKLRFGWEDDDPFRRLVFYTLEMEAYGDSVHCTFDLEVQRVPSVAFTSEAEETISLPNLEGCRLCEEDDLRLEIRLAGVGNGRFAGNNGNCVKFQSPKTTYVIRHQDYHDVKDANVSLDLTLEWNDAKDQFWISKRLLGNITEIQTPKPGPNYVKSDAWSQNHRRIGLTDDNIKSHRDRVKEQREDFKRRMQSNKFPNRDMWMNRPATERREAVRYASDSGDSGFPSTDDMGISNVAQQHGLYVEKIRELAKIYNRLDDQVIRVTAWQEKIENLKKDLRENARLDYRLFIVVDNREIDLVVTESFWDAPPEFEKTE